MTPSVLGLHTRALLEYLRKYELAKDRPWLLAISGGIDSMVLLDAFIELKQVGREGSLLLPEKLVLVHVNHGWREEAYRDLELIQKYLSQKTSEAFFLESHQLCPADKKRGENLEAKSREARYKCFQETARKYEAQHLFLAHHLQDKQECLLKNIFEGKELAYLDSLKALKELNGLTLARPFLDLDKKQIQKIAQEAAIPFEEDITNKDPSFLRSRMRQHLEPLLDQIWPKSWRKGLSQLTFFLEEWEGELRTKISQENLEPCPGILGFHWHLPCELNEEVRLRYWLREVSANIDPLQREGSFRIAEALLKNRRGFKYQSKKYLWLVNGHDLFALKGLWKRDELASSQKHVGPWRFALEEENTSSTLSWINLWKGYWVGPQFKKGSWLSLNELPASLRKSALHRYQNKHVPYFLREIAPVCLIENEEGHSLLWTFVDNSLATCYTHYRKGSRKWTWDP